MFRFIHCADLHLDSPFKGVAADLPQLAEILFRAQFEVWERIVTLALREKVDAVIIAGDAFDAAEQSLSARLRFEQQLARLDQAGIPSFYVCGNHDPLGNASRLRLPPSCHCFGAEVEKITLKREGAALANIYGVSYPKADVRDNLARRFPPREAGLPAVAVLHCNVGGNADHLPYAPATLEDLQAAGMDYWALGHVHRRMVLREAHPVVVYPGCMQGTDIRENGAHGCALVTLADDGDCTIDWHDLDAVRYCQEEIDISACELEQDVVAALVDNGLKLASALDSRHLILRVRLTGRPACGEKLRDPAALAQVVQSAREQLPSGRSLVWLESVTAAVTPVYDLDRLRAGDDFAAELIRRAEAMMADPALLPETLRQDWQQVFTRSRAAGLLTYPDEAAGAAVIREALFRVLDQLKTGEA